jgi:predicted dinucleotide-binding enzyme
MKKIGIIGSGPVGKSLAIGLKKYGYEVMISSRDTGKLDDLYRETNALTGTFNEAATFGEIIILAVKGSAAEEAVRSLAHQLAGKIVIDTTNPISDKAPSNGVLHFFTTFEESLLERLQKISPNAHFVKAFSCVGSAFMVDPSFESKPTMFICGNNDKAKAEVTSVLEKFGWEAMDMGYAESARAIEPLCILWCLPGFRQNQWSHAFKLMKLAPVPESVVI